MDIYIYIYIYIFVIRIFNGHCFPGSKAAEYKSIKWVYKYISILKLYLDEALSAQYV